MLPPKEHPTWRPLLYGETAHQFRCVPAGLMFSRIKRNLNNDNSRENYEKCLEEVYAFVAKYERILESDLSDIFK